MGAGLARARRSLLQQLGSPIKRFERDRRVRRIVGNFATNLIKLTREVRASTSRLSSAFTSAANSAAVVNLV
jgi:hypothetical protein